MSKKVSRREVRYAVHIPKTDYREDTHYVKEQIFYEDGTQEPRTFLVKDYERPIWCTHIRHRNHKDKKEFEEREKLVERKCTQSDLNKVVAGMLDLTHMANRPDALKASPYLYGYDQTSTSIIKLKSLMSNNFIQAPYTVAGFDIETDVDTMDIVIATVVFNGKAHMALTEKYAGNIQNLKPRFDAAMKKYLPDYEGKVQVNITVHKTEVEMLKTVFKTANDWAPDFLAIWNINFDIKRILERLKLFDVNPIDVLCDTKVPRQYRICRYKEGVSKREMASGVIKPISPSLQWHTLTSTSTFYVIDAMCVYRQIRVAKQEEPSYGLDAILTKVLGRGKIKFEEADAYKKEKWHRFMQSTYPIEYMVYNLFDCLGMLELDVKTKDLSGSMPSGAGMTDFAKFTSNPKRIVDAMFLFGLERGKVVGTAYKPKDKKDADEEDVEAVEVEDEEEPGEYESQDKYKGLGLKGWIQLLPQSQLMMEGLMCFEDYPDMPTNIRGMTWDVDATAAYPTCTEVGNVSKATCVNELISIEGLDVETFKEQNLSLCMGGVNLLEYFTVMFDMPTLQEIDKMI